VPTSSNKTPKWGILVGSKRKLTEVLTGEVLPRKEGELLRDDLLIGARANADFTGLTESQIYHKQSALGIVRLGLGRRAKKDVA
jgi:hypothetical protein